MLQRAGDEVYGIPGLRRILRLRKADFLVPHAISQCRYYWGQTEVPNDWFIPSLADGTVWVHSNEIGEDKDKNRDKKRELYKNPTFLGKKKKLNRCGGTGVWKRHESKKKRKKKQQKKKKKKKKYGADTLTNQWNE